MTAPAWLLTLVLLLGTPAAGLGTELTPFHSDGCSRFPDGTPTQPTLWRDCCVAHDLAYWQGGSRQQRLAADRQLRVCVSERAGAALGELMYSGVRLGGSPRWPTSYRWGFGWRPPRPYGPLSTTERQQVRQRLQGLNRSEMQQVGEDTQQRTAGDKQQ